MSSKSPNSNQLQDTKLKIVALLLTLVWLSLAVVFKPWEDFYTPQQRLEGLWLADFKKLKDSKTLPPQFSQIKQVKFDPLAPELKAFLQNAHTPNFNESTQGKYTLEIIMDKIEGGGVMIQYDLIDPKGNTVWELGRTFPQAIFKN